MGKGKELQRRVVSAREIRARKRRGEKVYEYSYFSILLNIYVPKQVVEKFGKEFIVEVDKDLGIVKVFPKKLEEMIKS